MRKSAIIVMITILFVSLFFINEGQASAAATDDSWIEFIHGSTNYWNREMANNIYSGSVSDETASSGLPAYRIELRDSDPIVNGSKRSEIAVMNADKAASEYVYKFNIMLPNGGGEDYELDPDGSEIIAQWHNTPDPGEEWTSPPLAIHTGAYYNQSDHYTLEVNYDAGSMSTNNTLKRARYDLGSYTNDKGRWVEWTVHVKWGWLESQDPLIEIYKDGSMIFETTQPNTTNDQQGVKMKIGVYKWDWAQSGAGNASILSKRVIYYDNVSITNVTDVAGNISQDQIAAQTVIDLIDQLPAEISLADEAAVAAARAAYDALTESQKALVTNYSRLTQAETVIETLLANQGDSTLSDLTLSSGTLTPGFKAGTTSYAAEVANNISSVTVTATANSTDAAIYVNETDTQSGKPSQTIDLAIGSNTIEILVVAPDGNTTLYNVNVIRLEATQSSDSTLKNLTVSVGDLQPDFSPNINRYYITVKKSVKSLKITPTVNDENAAVTVNGIRVESGQETPDIKLGVGKTNINITVFVEDGSTRTYTLVVTRK